jgi:hypothetical protein
MADRIKHWRDLWRLGVFWPLLRLTIYFPFTPKHLWSGSEGYTVRLYGIEDVWHG